jgi:hypothetical protein
MNPITFLFSILAPFLSISPDSVEDLKTNAEAWYDQSSLKTALEKYWFVPLLLPIIYPFVARKVNSLYDSIGDQNEDGELTIDDLILAAAQRIQNRTIQD